jgi:nucleoside-diphosphate-sugar epimerase
MTAQRVLVTGASGFIGRPMVAALLRAGYAVRAAARRPVSFPDAVEAVTITDLRNPIDWAPILQGVDSIVHLAGRAHGPVANADYSDFDLINWIATQQLAVAAKAAGIARLVYISTVRAQTGASAAVPVREQDEPRPTNYYGRSKLAAETAIQASGVPFTIFRPVVIYGPNPKGNMQTLARLAQLPLPLPIASFAGRRSLLGIDNLISAVIFALKNPATVNETYLLADRTPMTVGEILIVLRKGQGRSLKTMYIPRFVVRFLLALCGRTDLWLRISGGLVADTSKFELLGWRPVKDTSAGLLAMVQADDGKGVSKTQQVL